MTKSLTYLLFSFALAVTGPAFAQSIQSGNSARAVPVRYADLDLRETADAAALLSRLRSAANASCAPGGATQANQRLRRAIDRCSDQAVGAAVAQINQDELTRLHAQRR